MPCISEFFGKVGDFTGEIKYALYFVDKFKCSDSKYDGIVVLYALVYVAP